MTQSFRYEFTGSELLYFLFKKKRCPKCRGKMNKEKDVEIVDGSIYRGGDVPLYIEGRQVKHYFYMFSCEICGAKFTLTELANMKGDK